MIQLQRNKQMRIFYSQLILYLQNNMLVTKQNGQKKKLQQKSYHLKLYYMLNDRSQYLKVRTGYTIIPSSAQIFDRKFMIKDLIIRNQTTEIFWKGFVDLRFLQMPLCNLVELGPTHVQVYPDDNSKPLAGKQLNKTCFATFRKLPRINRNALKRICRQNELEIVKVDLKNKQFTVQIKHFTKYKFGLATQADDLQQQDYEQTEKNLIQHMRQNYDNRSKNNEINQKPQIKIEPVEKKRYQADPQLEEQIRQHNARNNHYILGKDIEGHTQTIAINGLTSCLTKSNNRHTILFNKNEKKTEEVANIILDICRGQKMKKINEYICSQQTPFQTKRVLALYMICFQIKKCEFVFYRQKQQQKLKLVRTQNPPEQYYLQNYLKNWFQWVINEDGNLVDVQNQLIKSLCKRKTKQLVKNLLDFNMLQDAQFVGSIEDKQYRFVEYPRNMKAELKKIKQGNMIDFKGSPWIVQFGVFLWYFNDMVKDINANQIAKQIIIDKINENSLYSLERYIISIYLKLVFKKQYIQSIDDNEIPLWWFVSNQKTFQQVEQCKKIGKDKMNLYLQSYDYYRFNMLTEIAGGFDDFRILFDLISRDNYLKKEQKLKICNFYIRKHPREAQNIQLSSWKQYSDLVNQNRAQNCYSNYQYFKALEYFGKCRQLSNISVQILRQIANKEQIICGFHKKTIQKVKVLLEKINHSVIQNHLLYLNILLGAQSLNKVKTQRLIELCYQIKQIKVRRKMLDNIFKAIIKSHTVILQLKKDESFYTKLTDHYVDPAYRLELRFAKIQL